MAIIIVIVVKGLFSASTKTESTHFATIRTQLATATKGRKIIKIKLISVKNHAYLLLTAFADPS